MSQPALLALYAPYCGGLSGEKDLSAALKILQSQLFDGLRTVEGASGHAYRLSWTGGQAPLETISCRLTFPSHPSLNYSFELVTHQLVSWFMQVDVQNRRSGDLPDAFWQWLLVGIEHDDDSA